MKVLNVVFGKISFLIISFIYIIYWNFYPSILEWCRSDFFCRLNEVQNIQVLRVIGTPLIGIFVMTLIMLKMDERIFNVWRVFACSAALYISYRMYQGFFKPTSGFLGGDLSGLSIYMYNVLFVLMSSIIVVVTWFILVRFIPKQKPATKMKR
jgi:hypothetical protein